MNRSFCLTLALGLAAATFGASPAAAQLSQGLGGSAAGAYLDTFRSSTRGATSIDAINNGILQQSRAYGASAGAGPVPTYNSSLSSGGARVPTLPSFASPATKPFKNATNGSTVSPYLNLFNTGSNGTQAIDNYNVLVRPQLQQQSVNRQLQRQQQQLNMRVQSISAQAAFNAAGSERVMATGHQTTFGYHSHFYPAKNRRR